jgi:trans-aconitate 2-methyltransferase
MNDTLPGEQPLAPRPTWDPAQYGRFSDERSRPFFDLTARVRVDEPATVVDLGCGPGNLTATLSERWPNAQVIGVDNDDAMLRAAGAVTHQRLRFERGDIASWEPPEPFDVIVSNAAMQWLPAHLALLPKLISALRTGGALAIQVPGNFEDAHHLAIRQVMARPRWRAALTGLPERSLSSYPAVVYQTELARLGCSVDCWETTYVHLLQGPNAVLEWVKGTALRPVLTALGATQAVEFCTELGELLNASFGSHEWGTPFPFKRIFAVAHRQ